jgi:DivIVA domain-containing protein
MDNAAPTQSILDTLRTVEFRLGLKGYNVDEVDEYLEKAAVEAEQVQDRLRTVNERLRHAVERIAQLEAELQRSPGERTVVLQPPAAPAPSDAAEPAVVASGVTEDTLQRTLLLAQKFVDQTKRESEAEAAQVVSRAEERARALLSEAEARARQIAAEAEERRRDEVARLEETRARLASDVEATSRHLEEQRTRIRESLTELLRWVDERMVAVPTRGSSEVAGKDAAAGSAQLATSGASVGSAGRPEPAGAGRSGASVTAGAAVLPGAAGSRQQGPAPVPERRATSDVPTSPALPVATTAPGRAQTPVGARLGASNGGLLGTEDDARGAEARRPERRPDG